MSDPFTMTIIISRPGSRQQSLNIMLRTIPEINLVISLDNYLDALKLINIIEGKGLNIVTLIDGQRLNESVEVGVKLLKEKTIQTYCVVLSEQPKYEEVYKSCGADVVLLEDFSALRFREIIQGLLPIKGSSQ